MVCLRFPAVFLFGLMLSGCFLLEVVEVCLTMNGDGVVWVFDAEAEESEESSEEEREGPEEREGKGKGKFEALLAAQRDGATIEAQLRHEALLPTSWQALVAGRIWEPPEQG